jgi:thiol:disulfide interchange protein DsbA
MVKKRQKKAKAVSKSSFGMKAAIAIGIILIGFFLLTGGNEKPQEEVTTPQGASKQLVLGLYPVLDKPSTQEPGKVKIVEFFSFYCDHCYRFNALKHQLESKYGDTLEFKLVPIVWGKQSIKTVEAYILAERYGKGREMADAMFKARFEKGLDIGDVNVLIALGRQIGLGEDFEKKLRSGAANREALSNIRLAQEYGVEETPTLIINGNIMVNPHPTGDDVFAMAQNLDVIIQRLLY